MGFRKVDAESEAGQYSIRRIGRLLHKVIPLRDSAGQAIQYIAKPLMVELRRRDVMQILVGAAILSIPVAFTEEVWRLGEHLPLLNVTILTMISIGFIALFVYSNFYRELFHKYRFEFLKRVLAIYLISLGVVAVLLTVIQVAPWEEQPMVALKRVIIVAFPASMSAAISDSIR
jgi:uncharacterized membrane protein